MNQDLISFVFLDPAARSVQAVPLSLWEPVPAVFPIDHPSALALMNMLVAALTTEQVDMVFSGRLSLLQQPYDVYQHRTAKTHFHTKDCVITHDYGIERLCGPTLFFRHLVPGVSALSVNGGFTLVSHLPKVIKWTQPEDPATSFFCQCSLLYNPPTSGVRVDYWPAREGRDCAVPSSELILAKELSVLDKTIYALIMSLRNMSHVQFTRVLCERALKIMAQKLSVSLSQLVELPFTANAI